MLKTNLTIICLNNRYGKNLAKRVADSLDMFFVNIEDILEYNLINDDMLKSAGKDYFEKKEGKAVKGLSTYENSLFCGNFTLFSKGNNIDVFKKNSYLIYIYFTKDALEKFDKTNDGFEQMVAFEQENEFCEQNADIVIKSTEDEDFDLQEIQNELVIFFKNKQDVGDDV